MSAHFLISGFQVRLARAALGWSVIDLGEHANVNKNTVVRFEKGRDTSLSTLTKLRETLENNGIEFLWQDGKEGILSPPNRG